MGYRLLLSTQTDTFLQRVSRLTILKNAYTFYLIILERKVWCLGTLRTTGTRPWGIYPTWEKRGKVMLYTKIYRRWLYIILIHLILFFPIKVIFIVVLLCLLQMNNNDCQRIWCRYTSLQAWKFFLRQYVELNLCFVSFFIFESFFLMIFLKSLLDVM